MGFVLMGFARNALLLYVGGVMIGLGCVFLTYLIAGTLLPHWFSQNLGTAIAVAMAGLGLGGIIFNPVISALVNGNGLLGLSRDGGPPMSSSEALSLSYVCLWQSSSSGTTPLTGECFPMVTETSPRKRA